MTNNIFDNSRGNSFLYNALFKLCYNMIWEEWNILKTRDLGNKSFGLQIDLLPNA